MTSENSRKGISRREMIKISVFGGLVTASLFALMQKLREGEVAYGYLKQLLHKVNERAYAGMASYTDVKVSTCAGNCTQACHMKAYLKGNVIARIQQAADYHVYDPVAKEAYNPRGCMRGISYVRYIYGPMRIKHPLIRVGPRGSGKFRRATWDEALDYIAEKMLSIIKNYGADSIVFFSPIPAYNYISASSGYRLCQILGGAGPLSFYDWYCDLPPGEPMTWGHQTEEAEELDWTNAKLIILWGSNIDESRIAAAHFLNEARYRGTKVISIFTDYNATARLSDLFVTINPGTDAALVNGICKILIDNKWYDENYVKLFTDMPFLVRVDTGKFLRESDLKENGNQYKLYVWNKLTNSLTEAIGCLGDERDTLDWSKYGIDPDLDFEGEIRLKDGSITRVKTVFRILKERLAEFNAQKVSEICGVNPDVIMQIAEDLHNLKPAMIIGGGGVNHWFNNDINNRSMIMLMALTGNVGIRGGGFNQYTGQYKVWLTGMPKYAGITMARPQNTTLFVWAHFVTELWRLGKPLDAILKDIESGVLTKLPDGSPVSTDPSAGRAYMNYLLIKSLAKGWMPLYPKPPKRPRAMVIWRGNFLNQAKGGANIIKWFADENMLELVVVIDFRTNSTAMYADVILPSATWYEKFDICTTPLHPYISTQNKVVDPLYESKSDFDIFKALAKRIQEKAKEMGGLTWYDEKYKIERDYTKVYDQFIDKACKVHPFFKGVGEGCLDTEEKVAHYILKMSPIMYPDPTAYEDNKEKFAPEVRDAIENLLFRGMIDEYILKIMELIKDHPMPMPAIQHRRPNVPWTDNVEMKIPWPAGGKLSKEAVKIPGTAMEVPRLLVMKYLGVIPGCTKTLTGRQQFYIDHSYFLSLGNELPIYKEPCVDKLPDGRPAPLKMNTPHGRWGTHSTFRDVDLLLRLQRSETIVMINPLDAMERGIKDDDLVLVYNEYGEMVAKAKLSPSIKPGQIRVDNGSELILTRKNWYEIVTPVRPKPTQSVVYPEEENPPGYHLNYGWNLWGVTGNECDTSVEVKKLGG
ncbi:molybdopterin-dependent oxidoreductase [Candidatus Methanodesulfokora washburnensis]|jgi:complex iron-sulfur molybdoenzyme family reductase subunit alpha|uniref:4Fe-4S Mo/W bis-MGD-type domain-containing protein n=1 Tax=Candidatus Methanodesulfokora washburnensis TaxID=2478471 RepID=A0A429GD24_9CREN|nr:molybdopterin-dependent oxidoreductase [Candidatus Methanodesulfokores washburnensis]RSN71728.1 hypothetical protein D6D85_15455 [Candidatus Methanodesulfokores washburnensis]